VNKRLRSDSERGFTIIEVMVAITLLLIAVLGVATMADGANVVSTTTKARVGATNLARELLEDARSFKYTDLSGNVPAGGSNTSLQDSYASIGITDARPSITGFQVSRRGIVYTVNLFSCVFDDSHDGARPSPGAGNPDVNAAGPYCLGSATAGSSGSSSDANPDDARKLEASVSWTFRGAVPDCKGANQTTASGATGGVGLACVTQSELIANPTGGLGPTILTLTNAPAGTVESGINSVVMNATTVSTAQSLTWSADDGSNGTAGPAAGDTDGTHWTFTWTLGSSSPADGTHLITAQAFLLNAGGVPKQAAVNLNRFIPATPQVTAGGVDSRKTTEPAAAVNWLANADNYAQRDRRHPGLQHRERGRHVVLRCARRPTQGFAQLRHERGMSARAAGRGGRMRQLLRRPLRSDVDDGKPDSPRVD
jgi:prepilin-type N-terminal cleavage/methylation domain-containing protein